MSRQFDAKHAALAAYPNDREAGVQMFVGYLGDVSESDFIYEEGMTPGEYVYGKPRSEAAAAGGPAQGATGRLRGLPEYLDYLEQSLIDLDIDLKLPENMLQPSIWADRVRAVLDAALAERSPGYGAYASYNWPGYLRDMIERTKLDAFDRGTLHQIADGLDALARQSPAASEDQTAITLTKMVEDNRNLQRELAEEQAKHALTLQELDRRSQPVIAAEAEAEMLALADEFFSAAKAHGAIGDKEEKTKCLRATYALRFLAASHAELARLASIWECLSIGTKKAIQEEDFMLHECIAKLTSTVRDDG
jgi:hypothetical protein